jgi:hypothetical protein
MAARYSKQSLTLNRSTEQSSAFLLKFSLPNVKFVMSRTGTVQKSRSDWLKITIQSALGAVSSCDLLARKLDKLNAAVG